jgi:sugar phosphate isomerase/epimerase
VLLNRLADGCAEITAAAALRGVRAGLEPEPGMFVGTVAEFDVLGVCIAERHGDRARPGLALDVGHVHCNREGDLSGILRAHAGDLVDVQIEDMREGEHLHLPFGEGTLPPGPVVSALRAVGYRGPLVVELSRDSHRAPEVAGAAIRVLRPLLV